MNASKTMLLHLMIFLSSFIYCDKNEMSIEKQDKLIEYLYQEKDNLNSLDSERIISYIHILKERKAVLQYTLAHQVGFFKNYEMLKGLVGIPYGLSGSVKSLFFFIGMAAATMPITEQDSPEEVALKEKVHNNWPVLAPMGLATAALSLWLLKSSCENLYIGWTRKKQSLAKIAKIDEILVLLQNV